MSIKVGIFNCPKVKKNDTVEVVYDVYRIGDYYYNARVICQVQGVECDDGFNDRILIRLPNNYNKIGSIEGWYGISRTVSEIKEYGLKSNELYWWIRTWRLVKSKSLDLE